MSDPFKTSSSAELRWDVFVAPSKPVVVVRRCIASGSPGGPEADERRRDDRRAGLGIRARSTRVSRGSSQEQTAPSQDTAERGARGRLGRAAAEGPRARAGGARFRRQHRRLLRRDLGRRGEGDPRAPRVGGRRLRRAGESARRRSADPERDRLRPTRSGAERLTIGASSRWRARGACALIRSGAGGA